MVYTALVQVTPLVCITQIGTGMLTEAMVVSVYDVAAYVIDKLGPVTTWKLQKLVYYCQAWSLVWDDDALFAEEIEAWSNGPVVRELYEVHRGEFRVDKPTNGTPSKLNDLQRETVDAVLDYYGDKSPQWLSDLTHMEDPWKDARQGVPAGERDNSIITKQSLASYYSSLPPE